MNKKPLINEIIAIISYIYMYIFENPEIMVKSGVLTERLLQTPQTPQQCHQLSLLSADSVTEDMIIIKLF